MYQSVLRDFHQHPISLIKKQLKGYKEQKFNRFYWWRTHKIKHPLPSKYSMRMRVLNGDFDPSPYLWMAQLVMYKMRDKCDLHRDNSSDQTMKLKKDLSRYHRLMSDYNKQELERLTLLKKTTLQSFQIDEKEYYKLLESPHNSIESFYNYLTEFKCMSSRERKKITYETAKKKGYVRG